MSLRLNLTVERSSLKDLPLCSISRILNREIGLAPRAGSWERVRLQEWLNFITSEIHAGSALLFNPSLPEDVKSIYRRRRFNYLQDQLNGKTYLMGSTFSVADVYLRSTWLV